MDNYEAVCASPALSGQVKLSLTDEGLTIEALFDTALITFAEMNAVSLSNYVVTLETNGGVYSFSRMGSWCEPFYDALSDSYNAAVLKALFIDDKPCVTATGDFGYIEGAHTASGRAAFAVYESCVSLLPPNLDARRVPLCFAVGMDKGNFSLTLRLNTGESYTFSKLGYDTAPFEEAIVKNIRALRERALAAVKEIDPALSSAQAAQISKLLPEGAAASIGKLSAIAPSFVKAVEQKLAAGRAAESYKVFQQLSDPMKIHVGLRRKTPGELAAELEAAEAAAAKIAEAGGEAPELTPPDPFLLWLIAPSSDLRYAAVEFAEENSATYVYSTGGDFDSFVGRLNRALEALSFKREAIRLSDDQLLSPDHAVYYMAAKRTAALQFVRAHLAGRAIHSSSTAWKKKLLELMK
ncbi:MAG: hypothetical protein LBM18_06560 [Oscillospiraceae bacterium]|jgi:hypothetical protein|nr:hypothetical protein [Oscillospiraceae bacterium]